MYDVIAYGKMIADSARLSAYIRAIETQVKPGAVVLDIGTGSGIMAFVACRAGARKVYAVEPNDVIHLARQAAGANGFADRIDFLQATTMEIDLPERVDGIVSDLRGALPMFGQSLASVLDARDRFLKPDGWLIAERDILWAAVASSSDLHAKFAKGWSNGHHFDLSALRAKAMNRWSEERVAAEMLVVEPKCWAALEYKTLHSPNVSGELSWTIERAATAHGVVAWFDTEVAPGIGFSNSPLANEEHVYRCAFFPWPEPTAVEPGDVVRVQLRTHLINDDYTWTWDASLTRSDLSVGAKYRQSTFEGTPFAPGRLGKRAHTFTPRLNAAASIDRRVLELMASQVTLARIADCLLVEFPDAFSDWSVALTRAGDLAERYSE